MKRIKYNNVLILVVTFVISIVFTIDAFASSSADTFGFSAEGIARGNAMTATVNDWSSVFYNISGLGKTPARAGAASSDGGKKILEESSKITEATETSGRNSELALNYLVAIPKFSIDSPKETKMDKDLESSAIGVGLVLDLCNLFSLDGALKAISSGAYDVLGGFVSSARFGLGLQLPGDGKLLKASDTDTRTHNFLRYGRESERIVILAGAGFGFLDDMFGFGGGVNALIIGSAGAVMDHVQIMNAEQRPHYQVKMDMEPLLAPNAGVYFSIGKFLSKSGIKNNYLNGIDLGLAYRGEVYMEIDPFTAVADLDLANVTLQLQIGILEFFTPNTYNAGLAYSAPVFGDIIGTLSFDLEYQQWSRFRVSDAREYYWARNGITFPEFVDIYVPKTGLKVQIIEWFSVSTGYYYQPSFVDSDASKGVFNFLDNRKHVFSGGFGFIVPAVAGIKNPVYINLGVQYQALKQRNVHKDKVRNWCTDEYAGAQYPVLNPDDPVEGQQAIDGYWTEINPDYKYGGASLQFTFDVVLKY